MIDCESLRQDSCDSSGEDSCGVCRGEMLSLGVEGWSCGLLLIDVGWSSLSAVMVPQRRERGGERVAERVHGLCD